MASPMRAVSGYAAEKLELRGGKRQRGQLQRRLATGVNRRGCRGHIPQYFGWRGRQREYPPNIITYFRI